MIGHAARRALRCLAQHAATRALSAAAPLPLLPPWPSATAGLEVAVTLPAAYYTHPAALQLELERVLYNSWQMVCDARSLPRAGDYRCGSLGDVRWLLVRGEDGALRAFHNVCRHHAAAVAQGDGNAQRFECPYHGWTYDQRGRLVKATRLKGIRDFKASQNGLHPIALDTWGHLVFLHLQGGRPPAAAAAGGAGAGAGGDAPQAPPRVAEWLGAGGRRLAQLGMADEGLVHLARREYELNCNWKVFADNYLDGGYHVSYAHKDLAAGLYLGSYSSEMHEVLSIQRCKAAGSDGSSSDGSSSDGSSSDGSSSGGSSSSSSSSSSSAGGSGRHAPPLHRLGAGRDAAASYAFVYPNLMLNRYGPWLDSNLVLPLNGSRSDACRVIFDYWLDAAVLRQAAGQPAPSSGSDGSSGGGVSAELLAAARESAFVRDSLAASHKVQEEDIALCEAVQAGLRSPAYGVGRYASPEGPMYHFHQLYYAALQQGGGAMQG